MKLYFYEVENQIAPTQTPSCQQGLILYQAAVCYIRLGHDVP
jgi:hypothetical protein